MYQLTGYTGIPWNLLMMARRRQSLSSLSDNTGICMLIAVLSVDQRMLRATRMSALSIKNNMRHIYRVMVK